MNIGIIGCGLIGKKRASAAGKNKITWVCDVDISRAESLARSTGAANVSADWKEVVGSKNVEALIVATTNNFLTPIVLAAVKAGKHVLVEKPAACSSRELEPLLSQIKRSGSVVRVGFNHRFHPALKKAKEIVDAGSVGELMFVRGRYGHGGRPGYEKEWRADPAVAGGGELIDQGMHLIDLSRWFLGDLVKAEGLAATYFWDMKVDDNAFLHLRDRKGRSAWLHASSTEWKNLFSFEIYGRHGKLQVDGLGGSYGVERLTYYKMLKTMGPPETTAWEYPFPDESWALEFEDFIRAIRKKRSSGGTPEDALAALKIVDKIYGKIKK